MNGRHKAGTDDKPTFRCRPRSFCCALAVRVAAVVPRLAAAGARRRRRRHNGPRHPSRSHPGKRPDDAAPSQPSPPTGVRSVLLPVAGQPTTVTPVPGGQRERERE